MKNIKVLLLVLLFPLFSNAAVWTANNTWDESWEAKFSTYIASGVSLDIFTQGKWANTIADCTDTSYILRIIFAFENSLPVRFHLEDGTIITNNDKRFDSTKDQTSRVHKFYALVSNSTSSATVYLDSYPVAITRHALRPGVMDVHRPLPSQPTGSGHSQYIRSIMDDGVLCFIWNSVPPAVRILSLTCGVSFVPTPETKNAGFRRWIWPQDASRDQALMDDFSSEQFTMGGDTKYNPPYYTIPTFAAAVTKRLFLRKVPKQEILNNYVPGICSYIELRAEVTAKARDLLAKTGGRCMNAQEYDDLSTPGRDSRLIDLYNGLFWQFAKRIKPNDPNSRFVAPEVESAINAKCPLKKYEATHSMNTYDFLGYLAVNATSPNPNDSYWVRWGYAGNKNTTCPKY